MVQSALKVKLEAFHSHSLCCCRYCADWINHMGGIALFAQLQNLITLLSSSLSNFIQNLSQWSNQEITLGPLSITVPELTTKYLSDLLISRVQPILEGAGSLIALAVSGGANLIFRMLMMYLIAFLSLLNLAVQTVNPRRYSRTMNRISNR